MIVKYYVYNKLTGEILRSGNCAPGDVALQANSEEEEARTGAADDLVNYHNVTSDLLLIKQPAPFNQDKTQIVADGIDELTLSGLPDPCVVVWPDGVETEVTGGSIQFSVDYPGVYELKLSSPIHLETGVSVEAIAVS